MFTKINVAGVDFHNVVMEEAVTFIVQMAQKTERPRYVCTGNLDHLVTLERDAEFREIYRNSDLTLADGKPVVLLSRVSARLSGGEALRARVTGSDLFWELARASAATGLRLFFLGGAEGAADAAKAAVLRRYPSAVICGTYCPPKAVFGTDAEQARIRQRVQESDADILFVGFGAPKQEKWIAANKDLLSVPVSVGVGGSFEMASGMVQRAPAWAQEAGLEWMYRFLQEPTRLWERYFVRDLPFFARLVCRIIMQRRPSAAVSTASLPGTKTI